MKPSNTRRKIIIALFSVLVLVLGFIGRLWFQPHRDVRSADADEQLTVAELTREFINDPSSANARYLRTDGNSNILVVSGPVYNIRTNNLGEAVVLIKADTAKMGVIATFLKDYSKEVLQLKKGALVSVKGAITSGNSYDADLNLYDHATLNQCVLLPQK